MAHYIATERLYLDKDGKVVKADDPARASLLVGVGGRLPIERAEELGLTGDMTLEENPKEKAITGSANKAVSGPSATKAAAAKAEELGVPLADVEGSGKGGNITVADIEAVAAPPAPKEEAPKAPAKGSKK
jgi:pyruvate/2-oxoglutarate dehydrogenase complex dihydrolipoamide acyltransferase (E2) component